MKTELVNGTPIRCYSLPESAGFDRWTVVYPHEDYSRAKPALRACVGMAGHGGAMIGRHLGKRVPFQTLPETLKRTVEMDTAVCECVKDSLLTD